MTLDQVLFLLLIVLMFGGRLVLPMLRRATGRAQGVHEGEDGEQAEGLSPAVSVERLVMPAKKAGPRRPQDRHHRSGPALTPVHRRDVQRVTPREARRGVVLMAVLGPCRGREPWSVSGELDRG